MSISNTQLIISIVIAVVLAGILAFLFWKQRKQAKPGAINMEKPDNASATPMLKLQAYERLILLADRISIPNLVGRSNQPGLSVREMQIPAHANPSSGV